MLHRSMAVTLVAPRVGVTPAPELEKRRSGWTIWRQFHEDFQQLIVYGVAPRSALAHRTLRVDFLAIDQI